MRILHLVPGSGGTFYCQNCLRDHILIRALRRRGHDVTLVPLYLPMYGGATAAATNAPLFFGGISVYIREKMPFLRHMPDWMDRFLNAPFLLRQAARREGATNASALGSMTLSMLEGRRGNQQQEFDRFLDWLKEQPKPDVIHISNALLLGFVPALREALETPVVCTLQDEEPWVNSMEPPHDRLCWDAMASLAREVRYFVVTSRWYAERMRERMKLGFEQVRVIYPGVDIPEHMPELLGAAPPTIGYLSRLNPAQGFEDLVGVFLQLREEPALAPLRLRATGGATQADLPFMETIDARLADACATAATDIRRDFQAAPDAAFFQGLTVMSAPARGGEAFGMHVIEAMSRGIPVVQPCVGAYPELLEPSGGGLLYDPNDAAGLADSLRELLIHPDLARSLGEQGFAYARRHFSAERMAEEMVALYEVLL